MEMSTLMMIAIALGSLFVLAMGFLGLVKAFYYKVPQGTALIVNNLGKVPHVSFTGGLVLPVIHKKELMRISLITLEVDRRGKDGLICKDNMRADITVAFYLRVNETPESVLKVAKAIGSERASDRAAVNDLFNAKFSEALKTAGKQIEFVQLFEDRIGFRDSIIKVIGDDLNGYILEDVAIDYLEQTPKADLDPNNIQDSEGIKKITELTAEQNVMTNELERDEELAIKKKNVETNEATLELERQEADATAKNQREIATVQAREEAETAKVREEERKKAQEARIEVDRDLAIKEENKDREIKVAEKGKERAVAVEEEKVTRARDLEVVSREREVDLQKIEADKAVEAQKKEIAGIVRERVAIDKTVVKEEEAIEEVKVVSEAERKKAAQVLAAEASAEEQKVKQVKAAEAESESAKHKANELTTMASAQLDADEKAAEGKKKLAEGIRAEAAAPGLAEAEVEVAQAKAIEETGLANANVTKAQGDADADALLGTGKAQAEVTAAQGSAEASAKKEVGMAGADVRREELKAEADGLTEKFDAMDKMSDKAREHEEYRMSVETALEQALASIEAGKEVARENAEVLAEALKNSNIDIVGGEEHFFNNFAKSLSLGKAVDGFASKSGLVEVLVNRFLAPKPASNDEAGSSKSPVAVDDEKQSA